jgi:hypothetical protein
MNVILTQPVEFALRTLGEEDRRRVTAWFDHLKNWENDSFVRARSHKLELPGNVYVLQTSTDFRIFFTFAKDEIVVLDVASRATLQSFGQVAEHGGS